MRCFVLLATVVSFARAADIYGVLASGQRAARPELVAYVKDLGAGWVRLNLGLDGKDEDFRLLLDAGVNVVLMLGHRDTANSDTTYGTLAKWPNAGFPFRSKAAYQQRIRDTLAPALPYLSKGRQVWVQCENEIGDAGVNPNAKFWRGTIDQYLAQLQAFHEAVRSVHPSIRVVLSSFTSESLSAAIDANNPRHELATARMKRLLASEYYDAADLHFYGCVADIPAKVRWVKEHMPADRRWISTENGGPDFRCRSTPTPRDKNPSLFEQTQAQQVPARLQACSDNGGVICLWFSLLDLRKETSAFNHLGLIDSYATPFRKKPAYFAFQKLTAPAHSTKATAPVGSSSRR